jgi:hypothetical protein
MPTLTARRPTRRDCRFRLSPSTTAPSLRTRRRTSRFSPSRFRAWPVFEWLEDYTLLSATIAGTVKLDQGGTGGLPAGAAGVPGETVFLDLAHDHQDQSATTVAATSTAIVPVTGQLGGVAAGTKSSSLQVQGLPGTITDLTVTMDLANNGKSPVTVALISPVGQTVPNLPNLFQILPGEHFVGSFNQNATTPVTLAPRPLAPGTYIPE